MFAEGGTKVQDDVAEVMVIPHITLWFLNCMFAQSHYCLAQDKSPCEENALN